MSIEESEVSFRSWGCSYIPWQYYTFRHFTLPLWWYPSLSGKELYISTQHPVSLPYVPKWRETFLRTTQYKLNHTSSRGFSLFCFWRNIISMSVAGLGGYNLSKVAVRPGPVVSLSSVIKGGEHNVTSYVMQIKVKQREKTSSGFSQVMLMQIKVKEVNWLGFLMAWHKKSWFPSPPLNKGGETLAGVPGEVWYGAPGGNLMWDRVCGSGGHFRSQ